MPRSNQVLRSYTDHLWAPSLGRGSCGTLVDGFRAWLNPGSRPQQRQMTESVMAWIRVSPQARVSDDLASSWRLGGGLFQRPCAIPNSVSRLPTCILRYHRCLLLQPLCLPQFCSDELEIKLKSWNLPFFSYKISLYIVLVVLELSM